MRDASLNTTDAIFSLPSPGRYVPDGPLDEASPRRRGCAKVTREVSVREEARLIFLAWLGGGLIP